MYRNIIKPILDFVCSLILIIILLPVILAVAIITYIELGSPVYNLRREREGKNKKIYIMYKFRTKKIDPDGTTESNTFTKLSRKIDKYRLNELPQLFNVLKGEMSLVGPRPFIPGDTLYPGEISEKRYLVRPGITGIAQVHGGRNIYHKQKLEYDIEYYDNMSFKLDMNILLITVKEMCHKSIDNRENANIEIKE